MKKGRVVEQGTHDQLVDAGGAYAALVAMQQAEGGPGGEDDDDEGAEDEGEEEEDGDGDNVVAEDADVQNRSLL